LNQYQIIIDHDEIYNFIETRYVGPVEACWRILEKKLQDKKSCYSTFTSSSS